MLKVKSVTFCQFSSRSFRGGRHSSSRPTRAKRVGVRRSKFCFQMAFKSRTSMLVVCITTASRAAGRFSQSMSVKLIIGKLGRNLLGAGLYTHLKISERREYRFLRHVG